MIGASSTGSGAIVKPSSRHISSIGRFRAAPRRRVRRCRVAGRCRSAGSSTGSRRRALSSRCGRRSRIRRAVGRDRRRNARPRAPCRRAAPAAPSPGRNRAATAAPPTHGVSAAHRREKAQPQILGRSYARPRSCSQRLVFRAQRSQFDSTVPSRNRSSALELLRIGRNRQARCPSRRARGATRIRASSATTPAASASSGLMSSSRISG